MSNLEVRAIAHANILHDLHSVWLPHDGQVYPGNQFFIEDKQFGFVQCGRKFGKTEFLLYFLYRQAMLSPGSQYYYIAPTAKQAGELVWENNRAPQFLKKLTDKYVSSINNTEMRIIFKNGSMVKCDGSDMHQAYRGINPHGIGYDEFKDHHPMFHEGMEPNLGTHQGKLCIVGTPPASSDNLYARLAEEYRRSSDSFFVKRPSWTNPHVKPEFFAKMRQKLIDRGEYDVWMREYEAEIYVGGSQSIFPMFRRDKYLRGYDECIREIRKNPKHWNFHVVADPGTAKKFAVLFVAFNKYTKISYRLDEIYEGRGEFNTTRKIRDKIKEKIEEIYPYEEAWSRTYDEAATWFQNEMQHEFDENWMPTRKALNKKENGLSLIKDQMLGGFWFITERCKKLSWEIENYMKDKNGNIPKENDHLIDCDRYANAAEGYVSTSEFAPREKDADELPRYKTMRQDIEEANSESDWVNSLASDLFDD